MEKKDKMKKKTRVEEMKEALAEVKEVLVGRKKPVAIYSVDPDAKAIRELLGITQEGFADLMGVSVYTLRGWEQGRRKPEGAAKVLLRMAGQEPETVARLARPLHVPEVEARGTRLAARKKPIRRRKMISA